MCLFRLSELYCVSTKMRRRPELMQLLIGMSMMRYFPAMGTAGFDRSCVRGKSRVPRPPPRITARQSFMVLPPKLDGPPHRIQTLSRRDRLGLALEGRTGPVQRE